MSRPLRVAHDREANQALRRTGCGQHRIVTLIGLADVKKRAQAGVGSKAMRQLHRLVVQEVKAGGLRSVAHAYVWNDSVLLLSYVDKDGPFEAVLQDAEMLKRRRDQLDKGPALAVAVQGRTFPPVHGGRAALPVPRVTVVEASSSTMANCFEIPKRSKLRGQWYVDGRIAERIPTLRVGSKTKVPLFPSRQARTRPPKKPGGGSCPHC